MKKVPFSLTNTIHHITKEYHSRKQMFREIQKGRDNLSFFNLHRVNNVHELQQILYLNSEELREKNRIIEELKIENERLKRDSNDCYAMFNEIDEFYKVNKLFNQNEEHLKNDYFKLMDMGNKLVNEVKYCKRKNNNVQKKLLKESNKLSKILSFNEMKYQNSEVINELTTEYIYIRNQIFLLKQQNNFENDKLLLKKLKLKKKRIKSKLLKLKDRNNNYKNYYKFKKEDNENNDNGNLIKSLQCPITKQFFIDPWILIETNQTYEKDAIQKWLINNNTDPMTNKFLKSKQIIQNIALKNAVDEWRKENCI